MPRFILGRIIQTIICVIIVATTVFIIVRLTGNPADVLTDPRATQEDYEQIVESLGLDKPLIVQYGMFMYRLAQGDFGKSFNYRRPALDVVFERLPATLQLVIVSMLLSIVIAVPLGVYAAVRKGSIFDIIGRCFAYLGQSVPSFWIGIILIFIFSVILGVLPTGGRGGPQHLILPAFTLGWVGAAGILRLTRSSMLDILGTDYILLAEAKGLSKRTVIWKHAFKNAAVPVLTFSSLNLIFILAGTVVTETVFSWPGVGRLMMTAVLMRDFPIVQCVVILLSIAFIFVNLVVDILYAWLNPKIRYR